MTKLEQLVRDALDAAGYKDSPTSTAALVECFIDYAAAGYWSNVDYIEVQEEIAEGFITVPMMCRALIQGMTKENKDGGESEVCERL